MTSNHKRTGKKAKRPKDKSGTALESLSQVQERSNSNSENNHLMKLARQIIDQTPEVRAEKVAVIKAALANGSYRPDSRKLANIILAKLLAGLE